jgi:hypothetical protein
MKYTLLLLGIVSILFSLYFFFETSDIFHDIVHRGFGKTNKADLLKPVLILLLGLFFLYLYYKQTKTSSNEK